MSCQFLPIFVVNHCVHVHYNCLSFDKPRTMQVLQYMEQLLFGKKMGVLWIEYLSLLKIKTLLSVKCQFNLSVYHIVTRSTNTFPISVMQYSSSRFIGHKNDRLFINTDG